MQCYIQFSVYFECFECFKREKKVRNLSVSCWNDCFDCHAGLGVKSVPTQGVYPVEQMRMDLSGVRAFFLPSSQLFRALGGTGQTEFLWDLLQVMLEVAGPSQFHCPGVFTGLWRVEAPVGGFSDHLWWIKISLKHLQYLLAAFCMKMLWELCLKLQLQVKSSLLEQEGFSRGQRRWFYRIQQVFYKLWVLLKWQQTISKGRSVRKDFDTSCIKGMLSNKLQGWFLTFMTLFSSVPFKVKLGSDF